MISSRLPFPLAEACHRSPQWSQSDGHNAVTRFVPLQWPSRHDLPYCSLPSPPIGARGINKRRQYGYCRPEPSDGHEALRFVADWSPCGGLLSVGAWVGGAAGFSCCELTRTSEPSLRVARSIRNPAFLAAPWSFHLRGDPIERNRYLLAGFDRRKHPVVLAGAGPGPASHFGRGRFFVAQLLPFYCRVSHLLLLHDITAKSGGPLSHRCR